MTRPRHAEEGGMETTIDLPDALGQAQTIALTPDEQLAFWKALAEPPVLTPAQRQLGELMRGKQ